MNRFESGFRRLVAYTVGGVALLAFALFLNALFTSQSQPGTSSALNGSPLQEAFGAELFAEPGDDIMPAWSPDGRYIAYVSTRELTPTLIVRDLQSGTATPLASPAWTPVWSPDGRHIAYIGPAPGGGNDVYVTDPAGSQPVKVSRTGEVKSGTGIPFWTPDSRSLVFSISGGLQVAAADGSSARNVPLGDAFGRLGVSSISTDGAHVLADGVTQSGLAGLMRIDLQSGAIESVTVPDAFPGWGVWSPDGRAVVYYAPEPNPSGGSMLRVVRLDTGQLHTLSGIGQGLTFSQYAWSPDSRFVAYSTARGPDGGEMIIAWADGSQRVSVPDAAVHTFGWSPDGTRLALSMRNGDQFDLVIIRADEQTLLAWLAAPKPEANPFELDYVSTDSPVEELRWSPDRQHIAFTVGDPSALYVRDLTSGDVTLIADNAWNPLWSPDGIRLVYMDKLSVQLIVTDRQGENRQPVGSGINVKHALWSPDGQTLLFTASDASMYAYSLAAQTVETIPIRGLDWFQAYGLSPDGESVLGIGGAQDSTTPGAMYWVDWRTGRASTSWGDAGVQEARPSPDGELIAYKLSTTADVVRIVRAGGGDVRTLAAPNGASIGQLAWSPDSRWLAFTTRIPLGDASEPYVARLEDGLIIPLLPQSSVGALAWSPDGSRIALGVHADQARNRGIGLARADEASLLARRVTSTPTPPAPPMATPPAFTTPGTPTPFPTPTPLTDRDFYWPQRLTDSDAMEGRPAVSPDGSRIAYAAEREGNWDIYVLDRASGVETRLTDDPNPDMAPAWAVDSTLIAYQHNVPSATGPVLIDVTVMKADGSDKRVVSSGSVWNGNEPPAWSPSGTLVAFTDSRDIAVRRAVDGREVARFRAPEVQAYRDPAWLDEQHVVFTGEGALIVGDVTTGAIEPASGTVGFARLPMTTLAYPRVAYFGLQGPTAQLISAYPNGNEPYVLAEVQANIIQHGAWSPDGRFIAYQTDRGVEVAIAFTPQYQPYAPMFRIATETASSDLLSVSWLPDSSGIVYVAAADGRPDLYLAQLNEPAIQYYLERMLYVGPTPPAPPTPAPTATPAPPPVTGVPVPPGQPPYWLQILYHEGTMQVVVSGQHVWLIDQNSNLLTSHDAGATWSSVALPPFTQRIAAWPRVEGTTLFASTTSSVYQSTDDGAHWQSILSGGDFNSVAVSGDGTLFASEHTDCRVHRSMDGGAVWRARPVVPEGCELLRVVVSPALPDGQVAYALTADRGLWRTRDRGETWQQIDAGFWTELAIDPTDPALVYAVNGATLLRWDENGGARNATIPISGAVEAAVGPDQAVYLGTLEGRVYASRDLGASWEEISTFSGEPMRDLAATEGVVYVALARMLVGGYWEGAPVPATPGTPSTLTPPMPTPTP